MSQPFWTIRDQTVEHRDSEPFFTQNHCIFNVFLFYDHSIYVLFPVTLFFTCHAHAYVMWLLIALLKRYIHLFRTEIRHSYGTEITVHNTHCNTSTITLMYIWNSASENYESEMHAWSNHTYIHMHINSIRTSNIAVL